METVENYVQAANDANSTALELAGDGNDLFAMLRSNEATMNATLALVAVVQRAIDVYLDERS